MYVRHTKFQPTKEKFLDRQILRIFIILTCTPWKKYIQKIEDLSTVILVIFLLKKLFFKENIAPNT